MVGAWRVAAFLLHAGRSLDVGGAGCGAGFSFCQRPVRGLCSVLNPRGFAGGGRQEEEPGFLAGCETQEL